MDVVKAVQKDHAMIVDLWEASVRATHDFLQDEDVKYFRQLMLSKYVVTADINCAKNSAGKICGFLGVENDNVDMLFVHPDHFGQGVGKFLMRFAMSDLGARKVDVNEQNPQARGFYEHLGFEVVGRSPLDGQGKPFPLLHLEYRSSVD